MRTIRMLALGLAAMLVAALVASAVGSTSLRAASAELRALQMASGVLCAPAGTDAPGHPSGHLHLGDGCCPALVHPDALPPTALPDRPADPAAIAHNNAAAATAAGHPAGKEFVEARGPPSLA